MIDLNKISPSEIDNLIVKMERDLTGAVGGYYDFFCAAWPHIEPMELIEEKYVKFLCDHMEALMLGRLKGNRLLINIPPGHSKPLWVGEPVLTRRGRVPLGEVRVGDEVLTHTGAWKRVSAVHEQGMLATVKVTTSHGREVIAAPDHPFLTPDGWKRAGDLSESDTLGIVLSTAVYGEELTPEEARFLGYMVGDGSCKFEQAQFCNADQEVLDDFSMCAESLGIDASKRYQKDGCGNVWTIALRGGRPSRVWEVLEPHGLRGKSSYTKRMPPTVINGGRETIANFLGAYWSCDGHISVRHQSKRNRISHVAKASTVSRDLAYDVQHALLRLGISSRVRRREVKQETKRQGSTYVSYDVQSQSQHGVARIARLPGLCSAKRADISLREFDTSHLLPDPVVSVEPFDRVECRCLTVEGDESFTVQDLAVHNSMICAVMSVPYLWTLDPTAHAICAHKSQDIGRDMARKTRMLVQSEWYQERWHNVRIVDDAKKVDRFSNSAGGGRITVTVRQQITGSHAKGKYGGLVIVDDPDRPDDTMNDAEEVSRWYREVLPTRFSSLSKSQICIVQQRISQRDLSAYVLDSGENYTHVCLPMEYDPDRHCNTEIGEDWRKKPGEILSPLRTTERDIARLKDVFSDPRIAEAQLSQKPVPEDGNLFKVEYFEGRYDAIPGVVQYTLSCDLTFTGENTSDYAVIQIWARGLADGKHYLVDNIRKKMGFVETANTILSLIKFYPRANVLIEKSASGFAVLEILKEAGIERVFEFKAGRTSKEARASTVSYLFDRGDIRFPRNARWLDEYIKELTGFPAMRHDDQVDATTQYLAWITGERPFDLYSAFMFADKMASRISA